MPTSKAEPTLATSSAWPPGGGWQSAMRFREKGRESHLSHTTLLDHGDIMCSPFLPTVRPDNEQSAGSASAPPAPTWLVPWVAGNKFHALPYIPDKADTLCGACGRWGHSEFRCQRGVATCTICADSHRTEEHRCQVATCGKVGKVCPHTEMKCPNCGGRHLAQDARCQAKRAAIESARGRRNGTVHAETSQPTRPAASCSSGGAARLNWVPGGEPAETSPDWTEDAMEVTATGMEPSGTAPPIAV